MDSKNGRRSKKGNKATPVIILKILRENTDENHLIQNSDIRRIDIISSELKHTLAMMSE